MLSTGGGSVAAHASSSLDLLPRAVRSLVESSCPSDPQWPNVTPYIVLIDKTGATQRGIGTPEPQMLKQWLP